MAAAHEYDGGVIGVYGDKLLETLYRKNYTVFEEGRLNLNIIGVRRKKLLVDKFNDLLFVLYKDVSEGWTYQWYPITTMPGKPWLLNPANPKGTAILAAGQYKLAYTLGEYKGYTALKQVRPVTVFRDFNKDAKFDFVKPETGYFGVHIHQASLWNKLVGVSSAGCQVFEDRDNYAEFIKLCKEAANTWGPRFTYTLLEEEDGLLS